MIVDMFGTAATALAIALFALLWRLLPIAVRSSEGCDAYYFMTCREYMRQQWRIPLVLPLFYSLERPQQDYPPGFSFFLALLPDRVMQRYHWAISPAIDALVCGMVYILAIALGATPTNASIGAVIYALSPAATLETASLSSRQLGTLLFGLSMIGAVAFSTSAHLAYLAAAVILGAILLMTHKLSTQGWLIGLLTLAGLTVDWRPLLVLVAAVGVALVLSRGFYWRIARTHIEYLDFHRHYTDLIGTDQIADSPVYGGQKMRKLSPEFPHNAREALGFARRMLQENEYLVVVLPASAMLMWGGVDALPGRVALLAAAMCVAGYLILLLPPLRCIGYGRQYGKLGLVLAACAIPALLPSSSLLGGLTILCLGFSLWRALHELRGVLADAPPAKGGLDTTSEELFAHVRSMREDALFFCLPANLYDKLVHYTRRSVVWGGHGGPVMPILDQTPVLNQRVEEIAAKYGATHLILDLNYATPERLSLAAPQVWENQRYAIYDLGPVTQGDT
jgi:hypothetical protein